MAEEGDKIEIVAKNMASRNYSIHPHGMLFRYVQFSMFASPTLSKLDLSDAFFY